MLTKMIILFVCKFEYGEFGFDFGKTKDAYMQECGSIIYFYLYPRFIRIKQTITLFYHVFTKTNIRGNR